MNLFGKKIEVVPDVKDLPSYWDDDYCQVEIVPRKNIGHIRNSISQIEEFVTKTQTEHGFTDVFVRGKHPYPTLNEELRVDSFERLLTEKGFNKARQIWYDGYRIIECTKETANALSLPCFDFFYDCKDEFINNIWISISTITSVDHFSVVLETLYELGESCELVLIDWNSSELVDLANRKEIYNYLMSYRK